MGGCAFETERSLIGTTMLDRMPQLRWFVVLQAVACTIGSVRSFHCDAEGMSYIKFCDEIMEDLNQCCIVHNECFVEELGRNKCDAELCNCLDNAASKAPSEITECGQLLWKECIEYNSRSYDAYEEAAYRKINAKATVITTTKAIASNTADETSVEHKRNKTKRIKSGQATSPSKSTQSATSSSLRCASVAGDLILEYLHNNARQKCTWYQDVFDECCFDDTICDPGISANPILCPIKFAECLLRRVSSHMNNGECYETIRKLYNELSSENSNYGGANIQLAGISSTTEMLSSSSSSIYLFHPGLLQAIRGWIGRLSRSAVSASTTVADSFETNPWKKALFTGLTLLLILMLVYMTFFSGALSSIQLKAPVKLLPEKTRLLQIV